MSFVRKQIVRCLLAGLLALAGFGAGAWFAVGQRVDALLAAYPAGGAPRARTLNDESLAPFQSEAEAVGAIFSAHQEKDRLRRGYELYEAVQRLDALQVAALAGRVARLGRVEQEGLLDPLLARWVELDSDGAAAWARPFLERAGAGDGLDEMVLNAWSRAAPEQALAEALKRPHSPASRAMVYAATYALAGENPAAQIDRLAALPAGQLREQALAAGLREWAKKDAAAAYAQLARLGQGREFENARSEILREWAGKDAASALAQLRALVPGLSAGISGSALVNRVVNAAAENNPAAALEWARALPESVRRDAMISALVAWAPKEPVAALEWARSHGLPLDAKMRGAFGDGGDLDFEQALIGAAMQADGDKAIEWLRKLPPGEERGRLLAQAIRENPNENSRSLLGELPPEELAGAARALAWNIGREDPEGSLQWAQSLKPGSARAEAIVIVASGNSRRFPNGVDALIEKFAPGADRDAALRGYAGAQWGEPAKGIEIAARIAAPDVREQALRGLARNWLYRDAAAAQSWLATTSELSPETKSVLLRQYREAQVNYRW